MRSPVITLVTAGATVAIAAGVATAAVAGTTDPPAETRSEARYTAAHRAEAAVSQADAERAAQRARPGRVFDTHLEREGHGLRWEVKTDDGTTVWEVQVDAASGRVVSDHPDE